MNGEDALLTTAEVAITLAGFTGIVAVLGRRGHGEWQPQEQLRLAMLLVSSFAAVLFALLPIALLGLGMSEAGSWALSSATKRLGAEAMRTLAWLAGGLVVVLLLLWGVILLFAEYGGEVVDLRTTDASGASSFVQKSEARVRTPEARPR